MGMQQYEQVVGELEEKAKANPALAPVLMKLRAEKAEVDENEDAYDLESLASWGRRWWPWSSPERRARKLSKELKKAEKFPYPFEDSGRGRRIRPHEIRHARELFLARLGLDDNTRESIAGDEAFASMAGALDDFSRDVVLAIEYYETRLRALQRWHWVAIGGSALIGLGALGAIVYFAFRSGDNAQAPAASVVAAQLGLLVSGAVGAVKTLASAADVKAQLGTFWKASSDLKSVLYTMEGQWRGQIPNGEAAAKPQLPPEFKTALLAAIEKARVIGEEERGAFFASLKSSSDVLPTVTDVFDTARMRRNEIRDALAERARANPQSPRP